MKKVLLLLSFAWAFAGCTATQGDDASSTSAITAGSAEGSEAGVDAKKPCRPKGPPPLRCHGEITPPSEACIDLKKLHDSVLAFCKEHREIIAGFDPKPGECAKGSAKVAKFVCCLPPPPPPPPPPPGAKPGDAKDGMGDKDAECEGPPPPPPPGCDGLPPPPPPPPEGEDGKLPPPPRSPEGEDGKLPPPPPAPEAG